MIWKTDYLSDYNALTFLNLKTGNYSWDYLQFSNNPNLQYVCCDEEDLDLVAAKLSTYGYTGCHTNTYCSFTPGGSYNTLTGTLSIDFNNNGCDANDIVQPFVRVNISDNSSSGTSFTNSNGVYHFYMPWVTIR